MVILALAAGCGENVRLDPGPRDRFYFPTSVGVIDHRLVVASSNSDLRYDDDTGGSLLAVDVVDPMTVAGAINVSSFAGELAIADPADPRSPCPVADPASGAVAVLPVRGAALVYLARVAAADGRLSCDGCEVAVSGANRGDPFAVGLACGDGVAKAFVGYLRTAAGQAILTQIDLTRTDLSADGAVQHAGFTGIGGQIEIGQVRGIAYDASRKRLYLTRTASGSSTSLRWVDLANDCRIDKIGEVGGCRTGTTRSGAVPAGLELRGIALSSTAVSGAPRRAYLSARIYDPVAAATAGVRIGDYDGLLLVVDLAEDLGGSLDFRIVDQIAIGYGASDVRVLPPRAGKRDVVAALAADDGVLWIYDDETGGRVALGRDPVTGAPLVGHVPSGLAVDPVALAGSAGEVARVYVGSFRENFVTPIDVPLDAPENACLITSGGTPGGACIAAGASPWRIGGTP
jgi:hypothetical protein